MPKFKEHVITLETKWRIENADFSSLMNEFKGMEILTKNQTHKVKEDDEDCLDI